MSYIIAWWYS